jgi:hypothetical protein
MALYLTTIPYVSGSVRGVPKIILVLLMLTLAARFMLVTKIDICNLPKGVGEQPHSIRTQPCI